MSRVAASTAPFFLAETQHGLAKPRGIWNDTRLSSLTGIDCGQATCIDHRVLHGMAAALPDSRPSGSRGVAPSRASWAKPLRSMPFELKFAPSKVVGWLYGIGRFSS